MVPILQPFRLTYVFHSCFLLELPTCALVFDYWRDSADGVVARFCATTTQCVYFVASHFHEDHFNRAILEIAVPHGEKRVLLSHDILRRHRAAREEPTAFLRRQQPYADEHLRLVPFASTDVGVSMAVEVGGLTLFHAGDLNNWHWTEESTEAEVRKMEGDYRAVLKSIAEVYHHFDLVMFPVDPRIGGEFYRGARQFVETFAVDLFVPMHFQPAYGRPVEFAPIAEAHGATFLNVGHEGEVLVDRLAD